METRADTSSARGVCRDVILIVAAACVLFVPALFTRDLWSPDEPRYMEVGREMVLLDDYRVPHLNGEPYPDKPPMFFWLAAGLYRAGCGYNGGRVAAGLASLGTILLVYAIGRRLLSARGALYAALVTLTAALFLATSKMGVIDPLLAFFTTAAICCGLWAMDGEKGRFRWWWLAAYAAAGLAVLTKGPVGVAVPAVVLVACGFVRGGKVRKGGWIHLAGAVLLLGMVAAWLAPALIRGGTAYSENILFRQTAGRVWKSYSHRNPFYYYILNSPWLFVPWTLFLVPAVWSAVKAWRDPDETASRLGLVWFGGVFLFFTLFSGKRTGYLMPLMPAFGLLMGRYLVRVNQGRPLWPRAHRAFVGVMLGVFALGFLAAVPGPALVGPICKLVYPGDVALIADVHAVMQGSLPVAVVFSLLGMLVVCGAWTAVYRQGKQRFLLPVLAGIILLLSLLGDITVLPRVNHFKSANNLVMAGKTCLEEADSVFLYYKDFEGAYTLYTGRIAMPVLEKAEDFERALAAPAKVAVIGHEKHIFRALGSPLRVGRIAASARVGHRRMLLITNWKSETVNGD